ncbi:MAG: alpha/beta hydrolase [Myxococcota bacterium]|nr:alpha/beta hydrolase [Myxococcota bacterium]
MNNHPIEFQYIRTNDIQLHVALCGPEDGTPIIFLHGFPEYWAGWKNQIPAFAEAGYRVIVPDQRGYNLSDKPKSVQDYDIDLLALDIVGLIDHFGHEKIHLVGHDWGAAVAWWLGVHHPERFHKIGILNVPHLAVMRRHMFTSVRQALKSWYIFFFQVPRLPEQIFIRKKGQAGLDMLRTTSNPGSFSEQELEGYANSWNQPGCATGMINWYRAMMKRAAQKQNKERVSVPVQIIWGTKDHALGHEMAEPSLRYCDDGKLEMIDRATHWVQHDAADDVNRLLLKFFSP